MMRLGKVERAILLACRPGLWTPPSVFLPAYRTCPVGQSYNRLCEKGLVEARSSLLARNLSPTDLQAEYAKFCPGRETAEHMAALRLTRLGVKVRAAAMARLEAELDAMCARMPDEDPFADEVPF